jgi:hypothetical protein
MISGSRRVPDARRLDAGTGGDRAHHHDTAAERPVTGQLA